VTNYLSESEQWSGYFWLPGAQSESQPGLLSFTPDRGVKLSLIGGFSDAQWVPNPQGQGRILTNPSRDWAVIHGFAHNKLITLLNCVAERSTAYGLPSSIAHQEIDAQQALVGVLLPDRDSPAFVGIDVEVENLSDWTDGSDVEIELVQNENSSRARWTVAVETAESQVADMADSGYAEMEGVSATLHRGYRLPDYDRRRSRLDVRTSASSYIAFTSETARPLGDWIKIAQLVQDLLSLATDTPCAILRQTVITSEEVQNASDLPTRSDVSVYTKELIVPHPDESAVPFYETLLTLQDIEFGTLLPRWASVQKKFEMTCHMVLGLRYINSGYLESQLMTVVGAAELMHRALDVDPPLPEKEFVALRQQLLEYVPENRKKWLEGKLWNEPTLKERLIYLASKPDHEVMKHLVPNPEAWAKATALARNGIAHRGRPTAANLQTVYAVVQVTTAVLIVNLLHQLAIPKERVLRALNDNSTLRHAVRLSAERWPVKKSA
jgi:hypothetical protein